MSLYDQFLAKGLELISKYGKDIQLVSKTVGSYSAATNSFTGDSEVSQTVKGIQREYLQKEIDGTIIQAQDRQYLISASGITAPKPEDTLIDGVTYNIINVNEIAPGGTAIVYKLQVRK